MYDKTSTFYKAEEVPEMDGQGAYQHKDKPLYMKDYHRRNLMATAEDRGEDARATPIMNQNEVQQQELIMQMHAAQDDEEDPNSEEESQNFFKSKPVEKVSRENEAQNRIDLTATDQDPETFLSNFMESRAWVPQDKVEYHPFDSDEDDEDDKADEFEAAYNMRFEDPTRSNEKLISHSRQAAAQYSVRRDENTGRKRAREAEREAKEAAKKVKEEEKARLRILRVEQAATKLKQFKAASGVRGEALSSEDWQKFIDAGWDSDKWDEEMAKRFGDQYYATKSEDDSDAEASGPKRRRLKKPKWNDEIDIGDIVPDFGVAHDADLALTDDESEAKSQARRVDTSLPTTGDIDASIDDSSGEVTNPKSKKRTQDPRQVRAERKKQARTERRRLEAAVEQEMSIDPAARTASKRPTGPFRYRETSPSAFGLSAQDILMAEDSSLNQYAGLKKLATFRDANKKQKDRRHLRKKARLRQWRKETFGNEDGPQLSLPEYIETRISGGIEPVSANANSAVTTGNDGSLAEQTRRKTKKRSRKKAVPAEGA